MKTKKIACFSILALGLVVTGFSLYYRVQLQRAMHGFESLSTPYSSNPFGQAIRSQASSKLQGYSRMINSFLIGGIIVTAIGAGLVYHMKKH